MNTVLVLMVLIVISTMDVCAQADSSKTEPQPQPDSVLQTPAKFSYTFSSSFGLTFQNISKSNDESSTTQWLTNIQTRIEWDNSRYGVISSLYLQYGQLHRPDKIPEKTQDNVLLSITPSIVIYPKTSFRLFLETTAETQMKKGVIDGYACHFLDPMFLYQSLFVGQKITHNADSGIGEMNIIYGVGYALQQTITDTFVLAQNRKYVITPDNPLSNVQSQVTLESGISAIFEINARKQIGELLQVNGSFKTVILTKPEIFKEVSKARLSSLGLASLSFGVVNIDYTIRIVYDSNLSPRRQLDQSLTAGVRLAL